MPVNILQVILITGVSVAIVALAFPWALATINQSMDMVEVSFIKSQFDTCSDRILETARTGTNNKCFFNINRGELVGRSDGLSYAISSSSDLCDEHSFVQIDEKRHIWQRCSVDSGVTIYEMKWMFPVELEIQGSEVTGIIMEGETQTGDIYFASSLNFRTLTVFVNFDYNEGESGRIVDITRTTITEDDVTLKVVFQ
ncbi:MAG: hypothetical protein JW700_00375 [Candidatus Aenigmarchaeota archaeon]|nr:hypothetical protein [Candidatus Aenigmarchaeota archaeon]